jgi:hypothetical protein
VQALTPGAAASEKTVDLREINMVSMAHLAGMFRESADQR